MRYDRLAKIMACSDKAYVNNSIELPNAIQSAIYKHFRVKCLSELGKGKLENLRSEANIDYRKVEIKDYGKHAEGYLLAYLPVNLYKTWLPLWQLLCKGELPTQPRILELGAGPGSATWGIIEFYKQLAMDNPIELFNFDYCAIEREEAFQTIFEELRLSMMRWDCCPNNLIEDQALFSRQNPSLQLCDAFDYMERYRGKPFDLIVESLMLNCCENTIEKYVYFLNCARKLLKENGKLIIIESAFGDDFSYLKEMCECAIHNGWDVYEQPERKELDLNSMSFLNEIKECGIRKEISGWFTSMILTKR